MKPHNVSSPRPRKDGKTFWHKVGVAWPRDDGGFKVDLDSLPLPDAEGKVMLLVSPPKDAAGYPDEGRADPAMQAPPRHNDLNDELPPF